MVPWLSAICSVHIDYFPIFSNFLPVQVVDVFHKFAQDQLDSAVVREILREILTDNISLDAEGKNSLKKFPEVVAYIEGRQ